MGSVTPISVIGKLRPAQGLTHSQYSASSTALPNAGAGVAADSLTQQSSNTTTGVFMFEMSEGMGLELFFASREDSATGETSTARIFREISICAATNDNPGQVTYRHLCDVALTASATHIGIVGGLVDDSFAWCIPVTSNDAGLDPVGTRTLQGLTTTEAGSVVIDPLCAGRIMVVTRIGTSAGVAVYAQKWSGL